MESAAWIALFCTLAGCAAPIHDVVTTTAHSSAVPSRAPDVELEKLLGRMESDGPETRTETRERLLAMGPVIVPRLLERIEHPAFIVRWKVVNLLGYLKDRRGLMPLIDRVAFDSNPHVRWRALWALAVMGQDEEIIDEFRRRLEDEGQRWNAAVGLSMFGDSAAIPTLVDGARSQDREIRFEAIFGLGRSFDENTSAVLVGLLEHPEVKTRNEVVMALGKIRDPAATEGLIRALDDGEPGVRWRAAMGLKRCDDPRAIPALERVLDNEADEYVVTHVRQALAELEASGRYRRP